MKDEIYNKKIDNIPAHLHDTHLPMEHIAMDQKLLIEIARRLGLTLTFTQSAEALITAKKSNPVDVQEDYERLLTWFSFNIPKLRPVGAFGNNFRLRKRSHEPFGHTPYGYGRNSIASKTA